MNRNPGSTTGITDQRGRVVATIEKVQNSVTLQMASDMVALYESGVSARKVAEEFSVHRQTVARHPRSAGVKMRRPGLSKIQAAQAEVLYLSGRTLAQVGEHLGLL